MYSNIGLSCHDTIPLREFPAKTKAYFFLHQSKGFLKIRRINKKKPSFCFRQKICLWNLNFLDSHKVCENVTSKRKDQLELFEAKNLTKLFISYWFYMSVYFSICGFYKQLADTRGRFQISVLDFSWPCSTVFRIIFLLQIIT